MESIGKSYEGRDIWCITITNSKTGRHSEKPAFYIDAAIHANEIQAVEVASYTVWYLLESYADNPFINSEGASQANRRLPKLLRHRRTRPGLGPPPFQDFHPQALHLLRQRFRVPLPHGLPPGTHEPTGPTPSVHARQPVGHGLSRNTVRDWLREGPDRSYAGGSRPGLLDKYYFWIQNQFNAGVRNADVLRQELEANGISVSLRTVERALRPFRQSYERAEQVTVRFETPPGKQMQVDFGEKWLQI